MGIPLDLDSHLAASRAYNTPVSNSTLLPLLLLSLARQKSSPDTSWKIKKDYDYIVVGGGTAGSVVASRLSELPCVNVLVLEAGPRAPLLNDVLALNFWFTDLDWQFKSAPQKYTGRGLINRQLTWPSGRGLGGSSLLNSAIHVRGNRKDYDGWAAMGAKGWSYKEVLPYFKKLEDNRDPDYVANGYHGVGGPLTVMRPSYDSDIRVPVFRAAKSMGYRIVDSNARTQTGFYDFQANLRDNQRCSSAKAYLVPAENRTNLDIVTNAFVKKVIIDKRRATGVLFDFEGQTFSVRAKREVIMSAGVVKTAQLLMLSGIGPREELQKFNIPVHADLPVGRNLQDHAGTNVEFTLSPHITEFSQKLSDDANIKRYIHNRTGPLASAEGVANIAFLLDDKINPPIDFPNSEIYFEEGSTTTARDQFNMKPEVYQKVYGPYENQPIMTCLVQQLHPRSRGTITLQSTNPYVPPIIDPNYLADPRDLDDLVEGMKSCKRIGNNPHMRRVGSRMFQTLYPGCEKYAGDDDAYFRCQARSVLITLSHYCGTTKMGDPRDPTTVTDPKLRVKNIQGLRVVDNSIMPTVVGGNTGVPAMMIGEKASDLIKETIECSHYDKQPFEDYQYGSPDWNPASFGDDYGRESEYSKLVSSLDEDMHRYPTNTGLQSNIMEIDSEYPSNQFVQIPLKQYYNPVPNIYGSNRNRRQRYNIDYSA